MAVARVDASDRRLYLQSGDRDALAQFDAQLAAQRQRERAGSPPGAPEPAPVNEAPPPAEEIVAPESQPASALAVAAPIALGAAAIDGPLPVGDAIGLIVLGGAAIFTLHQLTQANAANPGVVYANNTPPADAYDPDGAKAPGRPGEEEGFESPKGGDQWVQNPNGRGYGWKAADGKVWVPTGQGGSAHGGSHWDVQDPRRGTHQNVYPGGTTR